MNDLPIGGDISPYLDMYRRFRLNPENVPVDWQLYFEREGDSAGASPSETQTRESLMRELLSAYRRWGHLNADLDPLKLSARSEHPEIARLKSLLLASPAQAVDLAGQLGGRSISVERALQCLDQVYCGSIGVEFSHINAEKERAWLEEEFERTVATPVSAEERLLIVQTLVVADEFEAFFRKRFSTKKRFGLEGAEALLVFLEGAVQEAASRGFAEIVMGGMHRGRLNILANVLHKPLVEILAEVKGLDKAENAGWHLGDVPYHLGYSSERAIGDKRIHLSLSPHPSHLMAVAPVVSGRVRGKRGLRPEAADDVLCMLLHTDAAFCGQGVSAELLQLGGLAGYGVGGTVHCILNNQIGFTTRPSEGRTSRYCTDIGKMVEAPVIHVNANNPEAVLKVSQLALRWRRAFKRDILIDLVCYRRNGHNELDEPRFTEPHMYEAIDVAQPITALYLNSLAEQGAGVAGQVPQLAEQYRSDLEAAYKQIDAYISNSEKWRRDRWARIEPAGETEMLEPVATGVPSDALRQIGRAISAVPQGMTPHPKVAQFQKVRLTTIEEGAGINWATAEALAIGSLLSDGVSVRFAGQDAVRGTFTQRHWELHDVLTGKTVIPLQHLTSEAKFEPINSPLSEYGALAFEYGYSLCDPDHLTIWEAQFGDFLNGAQIAVDQFIVAGEAKWLRMSGMVMFLPHGPEGQGPEHSSARIERVLQLCAGGNIFVANCSTPANLFHILRRQAKAAYRKPLILLTPKSLLRNKSCVSLLSEMEEETRFLPVLGEAGGGLEDVKRIILCSGKVFYDLDRYRRDHNIRNVALIRLEQIYPFPLAALVAALGKYPASVDLVWCQEEPRNQGVWEYLRSRLLDTTAKEVMPGRKLPRCVARKAIPAPAGGSLDMHEKELREVVEGAFQGL